MRSRNQISKKIDVNQIYMKRYPLSNKALFLIMVAAIITFETSLQTKITEKELRTNIWKSHDARACASTNSSILYTCRHAYEQIQKHSISNTKQKLNQNECLNQ